MEKQICNVCNQEKPITDFYYRKDNQSYRRDCKDCFKRKKLIRESVQDVKDQRAFKERLRRVLHKDRINSTLREQRSTYLKDNVKEEGIKSANNRSTVIQQGVSSSDVRAWRTEQPDICVYCGATTSLGIDHITPLSSGGKHELDNLVVSCKPCNLSKHTNSVVYWLATKRQLIEAMDKKP